MAKNVHKHHSGLGRRRLLARCCGGLAGLLVPSVGRAASPAVPFANLEGRSRRRLRLQNPHTCESLDAVYWRDGCYDAETLGAVDWFMRDFHSGTETRIDRKLLDLICSLHLATESAEPLTLLSGYRSKKTNASLIEHGVGAAPNSFHIHGKAADLCMSGFSVKGLKYLVKARQIGGLGYYPSESGGFIHIDTGPIRSWHG